MVCFSSSFFVVVAANVNTTQQARSNKSSAEAHTVCRFNICATFSDRRRCRRIFGKMLFLWIIQWKCENKLRRVCHNRLRYRDRKKERETTKSMFDGERKKKASGVYEQIGRHCADTDKIPTLKKLKKQTTQMHTHWARRSTSTTHNYTLHTGTFLFACDLPAFVKAISVCCVNFDWNVISCKRRKFFTCHGILNQHSHRAQHFAYENKVKMAGSHQFAPHTISEFIEAH